MTWIRLYSKKMRMNTIYQVRSLLSMTIERSQILRNEGSIPYWVSCLHFSGHLCLSFFLRNFLQPWVPSFSHYWCYRTLLSDYYSIIRIIVISSLHVICSSFYAESMFLLEICIFIRSKCIQPNVNGNLILVPVASLLWYLRSPGRFTHDNAINTQHGHSCLRGQPKSPSLGTEGVEYFVVAS
jgi:hypothetical protein